MRSSPPVTPEAPPSPPPPTREGTSSCTQSRDPFENPPGIRDRDYTRPSTSAEEPFSRVFDDDEDERPSSKGKERSSAEAQWRRILREWKFMLMLENSGSVARDHLASERTFLAYVRTSLTMSSAGVGLVQLFSLSAAAAHRDDLERFARPLGAVMIGIGLYTLGVGVVRYFLVQDALIRGVYPVARVSTTLLSFAVIAVVISVFVIILLKT
ncbi:hypothetical protein BV20DRAFT_1033699 [Pilatotrama ljubarskyi]|nr:hypothetical protein BV20DRAFT_1033699 [Pilatotrama ljubarskyi]